MEDRIRFNWKDLFVKILFLVAFFLILLWLYPSNNLTPFYDRVYNENIQTMKEAAKNHYTKDKLPVEKDQNVKMSLETMEAKKLVLPFTDKDGRTCDLEESYVQVTKIDDNEYALKVSLTCGKQTDYIIDTIAFDNICESNNSCNDSENNNNDNDNNNNENNNENNDNDNNEEDSDKPPLDDDKECESLEYEYKRSTKKIEYGECPVGYYKNSNYCTKSTLDSKVPAKLITTPSRKVTTDANINQGNSYRVYADPSVKTTYTCSSEYDNAGTYNVPTDCIKTNKVSDPAVKKDTYTCGTQYSNAGTYTTYTKCYKDSQVSDPAVKKTTYTCSSEYDNAGTYNVPTTCKKTTTQTAQAPGTTTYTCSSEYDNAGTYNVPTVCYKTTRINNPATLSSTTTTYTCGSEYDNAGTYTYNVSCKKTSTAQAEPTTTPGYYTSWSCGTCDVKKYTTVQYDTTTKKYDPRGTAAEYVCTTSNCPGLITVYYYVVYTRSWVSAVTKYTCSSAYDNAGTYNVATTCTKTTYGTPTTNTTNKYTCDSSYINAGTYNTQVNCYKDQTTSKPAPSTTTYTCSSAYDNAGTYNVPTTCKKVTVSSTEAVKKDTYTCSSNYQNAGTYNVPTNCVYNSTSADEPIKKTQYICSNTYDNAGTYNVPTTCVRTTTTKIPAPVNESRTCPTGYTPSGTGTSMLCYKTVTNNDTYYCSDANAKLVGTKCEKTIKGTSKYTCDSGYLLSQKNCYKFTNSIIRLDEVDCKETIEYIWSPTETLEGWERTGETRMTDVKCPKVIDCSKDKTNISCQEPIEAK